MVVTTRSCAAWTDACHKPCLLTTREPALGL